LGLVPIVSNIVVQNMQSIQEESAVRGVKFSDMNPPIIDAFSCDCDGHCPNCSVTFHLDVACNANEMPNPDAMDVGEGGGEFTKSVTSYDLRTDRNDVAPVDSLAGQRIVRTLRGGTLFGEIPADLTGLDDHSPAPVGKGILLAKLRPGQRIKLTAVAKRGIGREHAKWTPVATAVYSNKPAISLSTDEVRSLTPAQQADFVAICPVNVFGLRDNDMAGGSPIAIEEPDACVYCNECTKAADGLGRPDLVQVVPTPDTFTMTIETTGALMPHAAVDAALRQLEAKLHKIASDTDGLIHAP
jgi:DNA-directed RNA polymerase II subunit RPB3